MVGSIRSDVASDSRRNASQYRRFSSDIFVNIFNCIKLGKTWKTLFVADSAQTALSVLQVEVWNSSVYLDQAVTGIGASGGFGGDSIESIIWV